eukprot:TRINITY_DN17849_c0_g1_i2.p1 TRINITY_DN17849_c0_g1~~TRINITY_DN17849_c0_g1_i2.p1  ORF type:complete len:263 (+),score=57.16 TRINITY_DN17849_c0_g1_i2:44-790(+)
MKRDAYLFNLADDLLNATPILTPTPKPAKRKLLYGGIKVGRIRPVKTQSAAFQIEKRLSDSLDKLGDKSKKLPQLLLYRMAFIEVLEVIGPVFQGLLGKIKLGYEQCLVHQFETDIKELKAIIFRKDETIKELESSLDKRKREITSLELDIANIKRQRTDSQPSGRSHSRKSEDYAFAPGPEGSALVAEPDVAEEHSDSPSLVDDVSAPIDIQSRCDPSEKESLSLSPTNWLSDIIDTSIVLEGLDDD